MPSIVLAGIFKMPGVVLANLGNNSLNLFAPLS